MRAAPAERLAAVWQCTAVPHGAPRRAAGRRAHKQPRMIEQTRPMSLSIAPAVPHSFARGCCRSCCCCVLVGVDHVRHTPAKTLETHSEKTQKTAPALGCRASLCLWCCARDLRRVLTACQVAPRTPGGQRAACADGALFLPVFSVQTRRNGLSERLLQARLAHNGRR